VGSAPKSGETGSEQARVVLPPRSKDSKAPLKGILREPREKFPEDPAPLREGVAPLKESLRDGRKGIPPGARWTKIDRRRVNPAALRAAHERFEERPDHVIVLRVLTREEIEALAAKTQQIRGAC
jgi:rubredoxin